MISIGLVGCATDAERLKAAAEKQAQAQAATILPDLPPKCRELMRRIQPQEGEKWRSVQLRWLTAADEQGARTSFCAAFYDDMRTRYAGTR